MIICSANANRRISAHNLNPRSSASFPYSPIQTRDLANARGQA